MSEMTPSVMMRSTKYWEPSCTAAAYLQARNRKEVREAGKMQNHKAVPKPRPKPLQLDLNITAFNTNTGVLDNYLDTEQKKPVSLFLQIFGG